MKDISSLLSKARKEKKITLDSASKKLKFKKEYLKIIESGDFDKLPEDLYIVGYLKGYSNFLGLDSNKIIADYKSHLPEPKHIQITDKDYFKAKPDMFNRGEAIVATGRIYFALSVLLVLVVIISFANFSDNEESEFVAESFETKIENAANDSTIVKLAFNFDRNIHNKFFFLATGDVVLDFLNEDDTTDNITLSFGELFFLDNSQNSLISSNKPELVEVYLNNEEEDFVGTLKDLYIVNER